MSKIVGGRWRKKPVEIVAVRFVVGRYTKGEWLEYVPEANIGALVTDKSDPEGLNSTDIRWFTIPTLEGHHEGSDGDWLITGVEGEHYFCKSAIFDKTYVAVH
jgi:hypothetical protein